MSHTPGPWVASHYLDTDEVGVLSMNNKVVVGLSSRITEDNARLIAAAPELAAELKHATAHIHDLRIVLEQAREMGLTLHMCGVTYDHEKALAVLAKATGGAQ